MRYNRKFNSKQFVIKTATVGLLLNMLVSPAVPAMAAAGNTPAVTEPSATAPTTAKSGVKIPSVESLGLEVESAVLIEPTTGEILLSVNANVPLPPASMTKMMTEYLVAEAVNNGQISWDQTVIIQENAAKQGGSRIFLAEKDEHTVEELYTAMAVYSANDATVALAELVSGSEQEFVELMNQTAQKMGMETAYFVNSTGLDRADMPEKYRPTNTDKENVMSAMDAAILAKYIVNDHPDFNRFTSKQSYQFRERDAKPMINYNWMLEANKNVQNFKAYAYEGLDGLKTGHTARAKYCFTGTAERDGMRLISVVMGAKTEPKRFIETKKVLDYGFNNFEIKQVVAPKAVIAGNETVPVLKGKNKDVSVVTDESVSFIVPKGTVAPEITTTVTINDPTTLVAPIAQSSKVGKVTYSYKVEGISQVQEKTVNLITAEEAEKASWFKLFLRAIGDFFGDIFTGIKNLF